MKRTKEKNSYFIGYFVKGHFTCSVRGILTLSEALQCSAPDDKDHYIVKALPSSGIRKCYVWKQTRSKILTWKWVKVGISVSARKGKGRELQQWVCEQISKLTGVEWGKDKPIESRPMGQSGPDVRLEKDVQREFPFTVECKRCESWSVPAWIEQAKKNAVEDTDWLLFIRRNDSEPVVVMDAMAFFKLLKKYDRLKCSDFYNS